MNRLRAASTVPVVLIAVFTLVGCKPRAPEAALPPPAASAAMPAVPAPASPAAAHASVVSVEVGNAVGADMRVARPMTTFAPTDAIHAAVSTTTSDPAATVPGKLGIKWTHIDSNQVVHEESRDISFSGPGMTDFQISKPDGWPTGKYKVEVSLDGHVVQSRDFEVK